jgi:hypothetical protein
MSPTVLVRTTAWLLALVLPACAPLSTPSSAAPAAASRWYVDDTEAHAAIDIASVLHYFAYVDSLEGPDLEREYRLAADELARSESAANQLRMALLRSLPGTPFSDFPGALALLESVHQRNPESQSLGDFSHLLRIMLGERMALDAKRQEAVAKLAHERQRLDSTQQKLTSEQQKLTSELEIAARRLKDQQARGDVLEKKIEEVKQIEKSMTERMAAAPGRR